MVARVENAVVSCVRYLGKAVWPAHLSFYYPHPGQWPLVGVVGAGLVLVSLCVGAVWFGRKFAFVPVGWFWFLISLIPVIGLVQVGQQAMADRYTYIPLTGVFITAVWGIGEIATRFGLSRLVLAMVACLVLVGFTLRTRGQLACWRDTQSLYDHALAVTGNNPTVNSFLSFYYFNQGNKAKEDGRLEEAEVWYRKAIGLNPAGGGAHNNLGMTLQIQGRLDEAIAEYYAAVKFAPTNANAHSNLGVALAGKEKLDRALEQLSEAVRLDPTNPDSRNNLGAVLVRLGKIKEAIVQYSEAARLEPGSAVVHDNLGDALLRDGQAGEAVEQYRRALQINPADPVALKRLRAIDSAQQGIK